MLQENFNVTWHNYTDHLREMLEEMHFDDSFADVTLVTDDKRQLKAHKNILSACSSVFKEILQINTNNNHPVIYLRGIQHSEMKSILKFIYSGESNFHEERMDEFLLVAKNLGIKELGNNAEVEDSVVSAENYVFDDKVVSDDIPSSQEALPLVKYSQEEQIITSRPCIPLVEQSVSPEGSSQGEENISDTVRKRRHNKAACEDGNYFCNQCEKQYTRPDHLTEHIQYEHEGIKYACKLCDYQAKQQGNLTAHIKSAHEDVRYDCDHCDKQFKRQDGLNHHIKSAHEGVKYVCDQCGHKATRQSDLKNHIKTIHEGVKYDCNECDKKYTDQSTLTKHIRSSHEGVKYACNQCSYEAKLQKQVKTHIQSVHEGVKYACNQCDHQSTSQSGLIKHIQCIHEGLKYDCNQCDRQFSHHSDLKFHIKSEHEGVRYACPHCNKQFKRPVSLHNHIQSSSCNVKYINNS